MAALSTTSSLIYRQVDFQASGGIVNDDSHEACLHNTQLLTRLLNEQSLQTIIIGRADDDSTVADTAFHFYPGVNAIHVNHVQVQVNGVIKFHRNYKDLQPRHNITMDQAGRPSPCISFFGGQNITLCSNNNNNKSSQQEQQRGILHGGGPEWWGIPYVGYAQVLEHRPYLLLFNHTTDLHIHNVVLQDAPFYHVQITDARRVHMHDLSIVSRRTAEYTHGMWDLSAFNTDGIDIAGQDVWVHDVDIWTQDDCIAVKDNPWSTSVQDRDKRVSSDMVFERIRASGLGLTIGSISGTHVQNITFRDSILFRTYKGIYTKFRSREQDYREPGPEPISLIENILYQNITIIEPLQYATWIGPAQQNGGHTANPCHASPCSLCWPHVPGAVCQAVPNATYRNITLRDIEIINPQGSPGVIQGSASHPIENLVFDNVRVRYDSKYKSVSLGQLQAWFPGLRYQVQDSWVHWTRMVVWMVVIGIAAIVVGRWCWVRQQRRSTGSARFDAEIWAPHCGRKKRMTLMLLFRGLAAIPFLLLVCFEIWLTRRLYQVDEYFVCDGVSNGVALGDTYPVPSCLADETSGVGTTGRTSVLPSWGEFTTLVFWGTAGAVTTTWWLKVLRKQAAMDSSRETLLYSTIDQHANSSHDEPEGFVDDSSENYFDADGSLVEGEDGVPSF